MNIKAFISSLGRGAQWPLRRVKEEVGEEIAEKAALAAKAALAEAPVLDALLDGKPVTVELTIRLKF